MSGSQEIVEAAKAGNDGSLDERSLGPCFRRKERAAITMGQNQRSTLNQGQTSQGLNNGMHEDDLFTLAAEEI